MHKKFFLIESTQTWVNLGHIEDVYYAKGWHIDMSSGKSFKLTDGEYPELKKLLEADFMPPHKPQDKKDE